MFELQWREGGYESYLFDFIIPCSNWNSIIIMIKSSFKPFYVEVSCEYWVCMYNVMYPIYLIFVSKCKKFFSLWVRFYFLHHFIKIKISSKKFLFTSNLIFFMEWKGTTFVLIVIGFYPPRKGLRNIQNTGRWHYSALASRQVSIYWLGFYV